MCLPSSLAGLKKLKNYQVPVPALELLLHLVKPKRCLWEAKDGTAHPVPYPYPSLAREDWTPLRDVISSVFQSEIGTDF